MNQEEAKILGYLLEIRGLKDTIEVLKRENERIIEQNKQLQEDLRKYGR